MSSRRKHALVAALVAALVGGMAADDGAADASGGATQKIGVVGSPNRVVANRTAEHIDRIVIHTTEGSFWGSVRWLRNPRARGSSHFVVSRTGRVVQLVSTSDVAWHAGDRRTNRRSIGIEHEGWAYRKGSITDVQYEASAKLAGYLAHRFGIPVDREHVIGHHEVPHPTDPHRRGGANGHTDPGPFWRWGHYLELVRRYAESPVPPEFERIALPKWKPAPKGQAGRAHPVAEREVRCGFRPSIHSTTIYDGQTLAGLVPWRARACGKRIHRVDFLIDGKLIWTARQKPFMFARGRPWNTTMLPNGSHLLTLRAYGPNGHRVRRQLRVRIANKPFAIETSGIAPEQAVSGEVRLHARPNVPAERITLHVGDEVVRGDGPGAVRRFLVDTSKLPNGTYELELRGKARDGRETVKTIPVLVANPEGEAGHPHVVWQSLSDWQTVSGSVPWHVLTEGEVEQVEFWVDGRLRWTAREAPYAFGGPGGLWDVAAERPGPKELVIRTVGRAGAVSESRSLIVFALAG